MKKSNTILLVFFFSPIWLFAQTNFHPGYIVLANQDTVYGEINYLNWRESPKSIAFRKKGETAQNYLPEKLNSFYINLEKPEIYISKKVPFTKMVYPEIGANDLRTSDTSKIETVERRVFLQAILRSDISLYQHTDKKKIRQYFISKDTLQFHELRKFYLNEADESKAFLQNGNIYKRQLKKLFYDCPKIRKQITKLKYDERDLKKLIFDYLACTGNQRDQVYQINTYKTKFKFGLIGGIQRSHINFFKTAPLGLNELDFPSTIRPNFGIVIRQLIPRTRERTSLNYELSYRKFSSTIVEEDIRSATIAQTITSRLDFTYIELNAYLRQNIFTSPKRPMGGFLQTGIYFSPSIQRVQSKNFEGNIFVNNKMRDLLTPTYNRIDWGIQAGTGFYFKNISAELRYNVGVGFSFDYSLMHRFSFLIGYML